MLQYVSQERTPLASEVTTAPAARVTQEVPHLRRVLGRWDLVWLFVAAIVNLNVVPTIAVKRRHDRLALVAGLAAFFFFIYGRRQAARKLAAAPAL